MRKINVTDIVLPVLSLALTLGVAFGFQPCAAHEDGSWMTCHWAGQAVLGVGAALSALNLLRFALSAKARKGLDLGVIALALLAALLPGRLISLCMMRTMRCRSVMQPAVLVIAVLITLAAAADMLLQAKNERKAEA